MPKKQKQTSAQRYDQFLLETQQRQGHQTGALYRAALTELIDGDMPPSGDAARRINQALVDALAQRYAEQLADRFERFVKDAVAQDPPGGQPEKPLREMFGSNGTD